MHARNNLGVSSVDHIIYFDGTTSHVCMKLKVPPSDFKMRLQDAGRKIEVMITHPKQLLRGGTYKLV